MIYGPPAPYSLRKRHCDCRRIGATCLMPASGVVEPHYLEAVVIAKPEGPQRRAKHAYVRCIRQVQSPNDCDW
jgi:hypothetical protein